MGRGWVLRTARLVITTPSWIEPIHDSVDHTFPPQLSKLVNHDELATLAWIDPIHAGVYSSKSICMSLAS